MTPTLKNIHQSFVIGFLPLSLFILFFIFIRFLDGCDWLDPIVWLTVGIQLCIAFLLLYVTQTFAITRERSYLPVSVFLLMAGTDTVLYHDWVGSLLALSVLICLYLLFHTYQNQKSQGISFCISAILTCGSLWWQSNLLLLPLFWYGFYRFQSLNSRTFFAAVLGILCIYLFLFSWCIYIDDLQAFVAFLPDSGLFRLRLFDFNLQELLILGYIALLFILSLVNIYFIGISEKVKTVSFLTYLLVFSFVVFIFFMLFNQWDKKWASIFYMSISLPVSHYFTMVKKSSTVWLIFATILFFLGMFVWRVYFSGP